MEKERRITAPDGCEIAKVEIVDGVAVVTFKEKDRYLPKSLEEFCEMYPIKEMTNEEKAQELGTKYQTPCHGIGDCEFEARQAALEMAEWKDEQHAKEKQQWIEKACKWLKENIDDYYVTGEFEQWFDDMFEDFRKEMKGGEE